MTVLLPIVHGIVLGDEEYYGTLDEEGNFQELEMPFQGHPSKINPITDTLGLEIPCEAEIIDENDVLAILSIDVTGGVVGCTAIRAMPGYELTGYLLRQAPIATLVREAAESHLVHLRKGFAVRFVQGNPVFSRENEVPDKPRRHTIDGDRLAMVARIYREAMAAGKPPAATVQHVLGPTTPENARRWISRARKEGYLGASLGQGRKGEATPRSHQAEP